MNIEQELGKNIDVYFDFKTRLVAIPLIQDYDLKSHLKGIFENLFFNIEYFKNKDNLKEMKICQLHCYDEAKFTAINPNNFSSQLKKLFDETHVKYWLKSNQLHLVINDLSNEQIFKLISTENIPANIKGLIKLQELLVDSNCPTKKIINLFSTMDFDDWINLYKYGDHLNGRISAFIMNILSDKHLEQLLLAYNSSLILELMAEQVGLKKRVASIIQSFDTF